MKLLFAKIRKLFAPPNFADAEKTRLARIVHFLHIALILASLFSILAAARLNTTIILVVGNLFILVVYGLNRKGYPREAGLILLIFFLIVTTSLLLVGSGIHDIAITALPVLLIMSALILDRRGVIAFAIMVILATGLVVYAETVGLSGIQIRSPEQTTFSDFVIVAAILTAAAYSSHILIDQLVKSLSRSRISEARVLSLVDNSPDFILEINRSGQILFTNKNSEAFFGKNMRDFLHSNQIDYALEQVENAFLTGQSQAFEFESIEPTGQAAWYLIRLAPVKHGDGITSLTVIGTNITVQKSTENALKVSEERYRLISTVSSDYMFSSILNNQGKMVINWVAGAFDPITGYTMEEYVSRGGWVAALHPNDLEQDQRDMDVLRSNQPVSTEVRTITKDNQVRWVGVYAHPVWDPLREQLIGVYGAVQDITERKQADEKIRQSANQLAMLNEIGRAVAVLTDLDNVLETIHKQLEKVMPLDAFFVTLYDPETKMLSHPLIIDQGQRWEEPDSELIPGTNTSFVIQTGKSILRLFSEEELEEDRRNPPILIGDQSKVTASMIFVPMVIKGRMIGIISAQTYTLNAYTEEDLSLLEGVSNQVAIAIEPGVRCPSRCADGSSQPDPF
jgi:PAS domain S-box-containing protein